MFYKYTLSLIMFLLPIEALSLSLTNNSLLCQNKEACAESRETADENKMSLEKSMPLRREKLSKDYLFQKNKQKTGPEEIIKKEDYLPEIRRLYNEIKHIDLSYPEEDNLLPVPFEKEDDSVRLTKRNIQEKKVKAGFYLATATAELLDSIYLPYFSRGLFNIIGTGYKIKAYGDKIERKYGVHFELSEEEAVVIYEGKF